MKLVIVESPSKGKTINKYLGSEYKVIASYGHIRQLPSKKGSVDPKKNFEMIWEETAQAKKNLKTLTSLVKQSDEIYLATDPDREGEAISWHIANYLKEKKLLKNKIIKRVVFNSITKTNILNAFKNTRDVDDNLVSSYLTRVALDYLVGFGISPILWRKMPGSRSAGRVQSVALRLICEREDERDVFEPQEYWSINTILDNKLKLESNLIFLDGKNINKLDIKNEQQATDVKNRIKKQSFILKEIEKKKLKRNPFAPFTTSTLQQDAFNKLGYGARKTMQIAQKLYEGVKLKSETVGLITYMRTDATQIDPLFIKEIRGHIEKEYGTKYLHPSERIYKTKAKNAQEAHEAIRPTNIKYNPLSVKDFLDNDAFQLYRLIWNRAIASQMASAVYDILSYIFHNNEDSIKLKSSGSTLEFDGFNIVYSPQTNEDKVNLLPKLTENTSLVAEDVILKQHFTEPPARYSEATLVKKLEELGIGRPSTYANIISVLQQRNYTAIINKRFIPEPRGRILSIFLTHFFSKYVEYSFTADLEKNLDAISNNDTSKETVLNNFWLNFEKKLESMAEISIKEVLDIINEKSLSHFSPNAQCPKCKNDTLMIKNSKHGPFIGCANYPECSYTRALEIESDEESKENSNNRKLGTHQGAEIFLKTGPYGPYVEKADGDIKRSSLPKGFDQKNITLDQAIFLLSLPKVVDEKENIQLAIGRFGPYLKKDSNFYSVKEDITTIDSKRAHEIIAAEIKKKEIKILGKYPRTKNDIVVKSGRYGPFIQYKNENIKIPKEYKNQDLTLEAAIEIIKSSKKNK